MLNSINVGYVDINIVQIKQYEGRVMIDSAFYHCE